MELLTGFSSLCPNNDFFLHFDSLKPFADHYNVDYLVLSNELSVVKPKLTKKALLTVIDLYRKLCQLKEVFPTLVALIERVSTIPVSSITCERTFSKMTRIKTAVQTSMIDNRLSDLCIPAVERDIDANFEQLIHEFSDIHNKTVELC